MKTRSGQDLCNLFLAQAWEESLQLADNRSNEGRKLVDRLGKLDQGVLSLFIEPLHPGDDGLLGDMKCFGSLRNRPSPGGPELQDLHALDGGVIRPSVWGYALEPLVFDPHFLSEQGDLMVSLSKLRVQSGLGRFSF